MHITKLRANLPNALIWKTTMGVSTLMESGWVRVRYSLSIRRQMLTAFKYKDVFFPN